MTLTTKRARIWRHNGLFGSVRMAEMAMLAVLDLDSTTPEAKQKAGQIYPLLQDLYRKLKTRIDSK